MPADNRPKKGTDKLRTKRNTFINETKEVLAIDLSCFGHPQDIPMEVCGRLMCGRGSGLGSHVWRGVEGEQAGLGMSPV